MLVKWKKTKPVCERSFQIKMGENIALLFRSDEESAFFSHLWIEWLQSKKHFEIITDDKKVIKVKISLPEVDLQFSETLTEHLLFHGIDTEKVDILKNKYVELPFEKKLEDCSQFERACCRVLLNHLEEKIVVIFHLLDDLTTSEIIALQLFEKKCQKSASVYIFSNPLFGKYCSTLYCQNKDNEFLLIKRSEAK